MTLSHSETQVDSDADDGTAGVAKDQAANLGSGAAEAGQHVAGVAKEQAGNVAAEATRQAKDLIGQAREEVSNQAGEQQKRLARTLGSLADELHSMAGNGSQDGIATDLAHQAAGRTKDIAAWLESREPGTVLDEVRDFARQRPVAFLGIALGVGLLAGRITRGVKDAPSADASTPNDFDGATLQWATTDEPGDGVRPFATSQDGAALNFVPDLDRR